MLNVYMIYRSVTRGQSAREILERAGIACDLRRSPGKLSPTGCAYALLVRQEDFHTADQALIRGGSPWDRVYFRNRDGSFTRMTP